MTTLSSPDMSSASTLVAASPMLPLEGAALRVTARGGIARVVLEQRFANHHAEPLSVTYVLPLPADAAVSGYSFCVGRAPDPGRDRSVHGSVKAGRARTARSSHGPGDHDRDLGEVT